MRGRRYQKFQSIESGKVAYNKLKAFEKTVLLCLMLRKCSTIDGKISPERFKEKSLFNDQFNITKQCNVCNN